MKRITKKTRIGIITVAILILTVVATSTVGVAETDPLVTLSYINETVIPKIKEEVTASVLAKIDEREAQKSEGKETEAPEEGEPVTPPEGTAPADPEAPEVKDEAPSSLKYTVVYMTKGQKLFAKGDITESTEVILRSGEVTCISPFSDQGIADMTDSKEIYNGESLTKNHYCLIPRGNDGRGICAVSGDAYILVRGEYEIVQE